MIVNISDEFLRAVLKLNNEHKVETSLLDSNKLSSMVKESFYAKAIGSCDAFLITFDHQAKYDSPNYHWFKNKLETFVYIDRIITSPRSRGKGYARKLYEDMFVQAKAAGFSQVVCEVNSKPPNPGSMAFHEKLGFRKIGEAEIHDGQKTVCYLAKDF